jgi:putative phosphoesterase
MTRIGLLSDTHSSIDERLLKFFENCDEIWHAGDIGNVETADSLSRLKPFRAVYGNIDGHELRTMYPRILNFNCEEAKIIITHIGGYPKHYESGIKELLKIEKPTIFISGHSHILKVIFDKELNLLHINPGAAGNSGFHNVKTAIRFAIDRNQIIDMEIWEAKR